MLSKNILVTGGAGYIGSHTCKTLYQSGYTPVTYDNLVYGHDWAVQWGPLEIGDIADRERLSFVIEKYQPTAVLHFAAFAYVGESVENPAKYYRNNVVGSLTLLEVLKDFNIDKFIFSSTCATYGIPQQIPIIEDQPQNPINAYGASKLMVERMLFDFDLAYKLRSISLRYFNAAGADLDNQIGEAHNPETHLIPLVIDVALGKRKSITIYGNDYNTPDGTCIRDYIHVNDLAQAHVLALQALEKGAQTNVYNLGNGNGFSVRQIIDTTEKIVGKPITVEIGQRRAGDPAVLVGDAAKIKSKLLWKPQHNDISIIIESAYKWHQKEKV